MPLLAISLLISILISTLLGVVIVKTDNYNVQLKQPIYNRRHNAGRNGLLNINKEVIY
jgi:hypothetical protein